MIPTHLYTVLLRALLAVWLIFLGHHASGAPVPAENAKPGSANWVLQNPARNGEIEGYASLASVNRGSSIALYVHTAAPTFTASVYRMGYYGGAGARLMTSLTNLPGKVQKKPCANPAGVIECNWQVSATLTIPADTSDETSLGYWPSGIYLVKLSMNSAVPTDNYDSYVLFVVRDDARNADYVAQLPDTTYQAYNYWGGQSLYTGCAIHNVDWTCQNGAKRANRVSFNRPYGPSTNPAAKYGSGAGEFITNVQPVAEGYPITSSGFDYNMVRWLERQGYDVKYVSSIDLHQDASRLSRAPALLMMGHDEYYSSAMRDNLQAFVQAGKNLAFFSSNEIYWQLRFENGVYGSSPGERIMVVYKDGNDPVTSAALTTGRFRDLGRPEAALIGSQYVKDPVQGDIHIVNPYHWLLNGSGATDTTYLRGLLGYEINAKVAGVSPANTVVLAHSDGGGGSYGDMTFYVAAAGAQVFATGSMQWAWGLDGFISNGTRADFTSPVAQTITANVLDAVAERGLIALVNASSGLSLSAAPGAAATSQAAASTGQARSDAWRQLPSTDSGKSILVARASGLCMDAYGTAAGAVVGTWDCNGTSQQKWTMLDKGGGLFALVDTRSGLCAEGASTGAGVTLRACADIKAQQWKRAAWRGATDPVPPDTPVASGMTLTMTSALGPYLVGLSGTDAAPVVQKSAAAGPSVTNWKTVASGDGIHLRLVAVGNDLCLDAYGATSGALVGTWECHGGSNQDWQFSTLADGSYQVVNSRSALCLATGSGVATADGAIVLASCTQVAGQRWSVAASPTAAEPSYVLSNKRSALAATVPAGGPAAAALVQSSATPLYRWKFGVAADPAFSKISALDSGLCLDAYGSVAGAAVGTWSCHGGDNQQWRQVSGADATLQLVDKRSGLCLGVAGASLAQGAPLALMVCGSADEQWWRKLSQ